MRDVQTLAGGHGSQPTYVQNEALQLRMIGHYVHGREDPWTGLNLQPSTGDPAKRHQTVVPSNKPFPNYGSFRSPPAPPSEADTISPSLAGIMSDSGYGSLARQSVGNQSVYGDGDQSIELIPRFQAMGQDRNSWNEELGRREGPDPRPAPGTLSARVFVCPDPECRAEVKTKSELK
jgi:hypothetical protein